MGHTAKNEQPPAQPGGRNLPPAARHFVVLGASSAALAVALGAFGAHSLKAVLDPGMQGVYQTAVLYHLVHSLGLFGVALACLMRPGNNLARMAGWVMASGTFLFCASLYLLAVTGNHWMGVITPLGGGAMIVSWLLLAVAAWR